MTSNNCHDPNSKVPSNWSKLSESSDLRLTGGWSIRCSVGGSVARANAPSESIIRFTQRSFEKAIKSITMSDRNMGERDQGREALKSRPALHLKEDSQ